MPVQARLKSSGISIGALAGLAGIKPSAVRYYEAAGLMAAPPRRGGRRVYGMTDVEPLRMLTGARGLGFSIRELKLLAGADAQGRRLAAAERSATLREMNHRLGATADRLDTLAACGCSSDAECGLLAA